ncbi:MAG TPA: phosphatidate cytidylyltransferase [Alphaproteobacteria bacterium]|nr:phosphatidate cytidylyltransferase [Alphaproteobacteria bacterium]
MAHPPASASSTSASFKLRLVSALAMAPIALVMAWLGGWALAAFVAGAAVLASLEWSRLTISDWQTPGAAIMIAVMLAAIFVAALAAFDWALGLVIAAATVIVLAGLVGRPLVWLGAGILYVGLPCLALLWLRALPSSGLETLLWVLVLVWAVDVAAYFTGRAIGGPKLAPQISPSKTWAGLGGGVAAAAMVGLAAASLTGAKLLPLTVVSAGLAIVEQAGDLLESAVKRHFRVKDAGRLIPGHGGLMDRVDGLVTTLVAVAAITVATGGSPLAWR